MGESFVTVLLVHRIGLGQGITGQTVPDALNSLDNLVIESKYGEQFVDSTGLDAGRPEQH